MADKAASAGGIGFCGLLTVAFIVLKLTHTIAWSWLWILAPLWIPTALVLAVVAVVVIIAFIAFLFERRQRSFR